jgi:DNA-binding transcriptional LysR family regulator
MKIDLLGLEAFVGVAELGSFTRAAEHLNLSQTAVTHRVKKLEGNLGVQLFRRSHRDVVLTEDGADLLPRIKNTLAGMDAELERVRARAVVRRQKLTLACLPTIAMKMLPEALRTFSASHPDVAVSVLDTSASEIGPLVANGIVEFGLTIIAASNQDLVTEALFTEDYLVVCPAAHAFSKRTQIGDQVTWAELLGEKLIRVNSQTANRFIVDQALGSRSEAPNWAYEVQHTITALKLVSEGLGLTVMPRSAVDALQTEDVCVLPLSRPSISRTIGILSRRNVGLSPLAADLCAALKQIGARSRQERA